MSPTMTASKRCRSSTSIEIDGGKAWSSSATLGAKGRGVASRYEDLTPAGTHPGHSPLPHHSTRPRLLPRPRYALSPTLRPAPIYLFTNFRTFIRKSAP